ncbi:Crp/Fnr family transcriptional regulator [Paenibacillus donghaensis]|uniref:cAMP-binding protein n=1 Tax=Paenibacillus donghaensis TaxID=414771 RepID=A0A2Z2KBU8_9BACL|nr:Crp/Fnr family transcriptional regulator [Paenibacillus donghaensis]ASA20470.1 cAMP-binding protein [Paenibacillus donghaensis]
MNNIQYLSQFQLMNSLSPEDLLEMDQLTSITVFPKNSLIQTPQTFREGFYFVKKGKLRLYKLSAEGKQFTLDILGEGNVFGELNGLSFGTRDLFIETIGECDICLLDQERAADFLLHHPRFMLSLMEVLGRRIAELTSLAHQLALGDLHHRILHVLLRLAGLFGSGEQDGYVTIGLPLTHQQVAHLAGASREAVSGALQELARQGLIRTGFKSVAVNRDALHNEAWN